MIIPNPRPRLQPVPGAGFSLLEVMVATVIFFSCTFAILQLISITLRNARVLQMREPNAGMLAADLALTNSLVEDQMTGDFKDSYPGYRWARDVYQVSSNGLFEADFTVERQGGRGQAATHMSILLFRPMSPQAPVRGELK